jgi:outer membrane lipoprotein-sorting protein
VCAMGVVPLALGLVAEVIWVAPGRAGDMPPASPTQAAGIIEKMQVAYANVEQYQTETEVQTYRGGKVVETRRFLYTFRKPNHIRLDFEAPHRGMILVYPDEDGRVLVKPGGWLSFLKLRLAPDSARLRSPAGQRIDQTDLGLLIQNIARSLTDRRRGEMKVNAQGGRTEIEVLAEDHFLPGVLTLYRFTVDEASWLPVEVQELTPDGVPKRQVSFGNLKTSISVPEGHFRIGDRNRDHGRSHS